MDELFAELPEQRGRDVKEGGAPRLRLPQRDQMILCPGSLDTMLPADHVVRAVEAFVGKMDLRVLYDAIRSREGLPGHPPADPKLLVALWLYATIDGVGSARALARLCETSLPYQWLCGGVGMNHHTLSDARIAHAAWLDAAITKSIAALLAAGAITLTEIAQDGLRVRASAGTKSFRRRATLERFLDEAKQRVAQLKRELDTDPTAAQKRAQAAARRAAEDRERRLAEAVAALAEAEKRAVRNKKKPETARTSFTDDQATVMRMPDGGYRPAYNTQIAVETEHGLIVGLDVSTTGADQPSLEPMVAQVNARTGASIKTVLADGGFFSHASVTRLTEAGIELLVPPPEPKKSDRSADQPTRRDTEAVAALRERMAEPKNQERYRQRARWIEWVNAGWRHRGWRQVSVRGQARVYAVACWQAMAHNVSRIIVTPALAKAFA